MGARIKRSQAEGLEVIMQQFLESAACKEYFDSFNFISRGFANAALSAQGDGLTFEGLRKGVVSQGMVGGAMSEILAHADFSQDSVDKLSSLSIFRPRDIAATGEALLVASGVQDSYVSSIEFAEGAIASRVANASTFELRVIGGIDEVFTKFKEEVQSMSPEAFSASVISAAGKVSARHGPPERSASAPDRKPEEKEGGFAQREQVRRTQSAPGDMIR